MNIDLKSNPRNKRSGYYSNHGYYIIVTYESMNSVYIAVHL